LDAVLDALRPLSQASHAGLQLGGVHHHLHFFDGQSDQRAAQWPSQLVEGEYVVEVKGEEGARGDLEQLESVNPLRILLSQLQQVLYVEQISLLTLDRKTNFLLDLLLVEELHQVVVAEVALVAATQIYEESLDDFVDRNLRKLLRLNLAIQVRENPVHRLEARHESDCVHHFYFAHAHVRPLLGVPSTFMCLQKVLFSRKLPLRRRN